MKSVFDQLKSDSFKEQLINIIKNFDTLKGGEGTRNIIKTIEVDNINLNIKAFKKPNIVNQIVYRFFRKSKAQRSFEYATILHSLGIGTPNPIAYFEFPSFFLFKKSFYVSEHLNYDLTYRELIHDFNYPDYDTILRAFTRFTFNLHEKGIHFLDHSPGNTLIKNVENGYEFYLVDLNRMKFESMDFEARMKNFARVTKYKSMIEIMSDEYAKVSGEKYEKVFEAMWAYRTEFRQKIERKNRLKKALRFWRTSN